MKNLVDYSDLLLNIFNKVDIFVMGNIADEQIESK